MSSPPLVLQLLRRFTRRLKWNLLIVLLWTLVLVGWIYRRQQGDDGERSHDSDVLVFDAKTATKLYPPGMPWPWSHPFENTCKFVVLDAEDPSIARFVKHDREDDCAQFANDAFLSTLVRQHSDGTIEVTHATDEFLDAKCTLQVLSGTLRPNSSTASVLEEIELSLNSHFYVNRDSVAIKCVGRRKAGDGAKTEATLPSRNSTENRPSEEEKANDEIGANWDREKPHEHEETDPDLAAEKERQLELQARNETHEQRSGNSEDDDGNGWREIFHAEFMSIREKGLGPSTIVEIKDFQRLRREILVDRDRLLASKDEAEFFAKMGISILGLESVSRSQFERHCEKSLAVMRDLGFVEMLGYGKIADNSIPNWLNIISLVNVTEFEEELSLDELRFVWQSAKNRQCRTSYADDVGVSTNGLFHYSKKFGPKPLRGFSRPPADHYYRPYFVQHYHREGPLRRCTATGELEAARQISAWRRRIDRFSGAHCFFDFTFLSPLMHDNSNRLEWLDDRISSELEALKSSGSLEHTAIILVADHGQRLSYSKYAYAGAVEERQPMLAVYLPPKFRALFPRHIATLRHNANRLMTNIDLRELLLDLLDMPGRLKPKPPKGGAVISHIKGALSPLRSLIPNARTCEAARIPHEFCLCTERPEKEDEFQAIWPKEAAIGELKDYASQLGTCVDVQTIECEGTPTYRRVNDWVLHLIRSRKPKSTLRRQLATKVSPKRYVYYAEDRCQMRLKAMEDTRINLVARYRVDPLRAEIQLSHHPLVWAETLTRWKAFKGCAQMRYLAFLCDCLDRATSRH